MTPPGLENTLPSFAAIDDHDPLVSLHIERGVDRDAENQAGYRNHCEICFGLQHDAAARILWEKSWITAPKFSFCYRIGQLRSGCPTCRLLLDGVNLCCSDLRYLLFDQTPFHLLFDKGKSMCMEFSDKQGSGNFRVEFFIEPGQETGLPCLGKATKIITDPTSKSLASVSSQWLQECQENHLYCNKPTFSPLPDRILDLRTDTYRLYKTVGEIAPYVALSYCWGSINDNLTTTRATIVERQEKIPSESMPRTFQDAILFTKQLGIHYLWIDSLCIVQDDEEEWALAASQMATIYEGATLVLSATASSNPHVGLFVHREEPLAQFPVHEVEQRGSDGRTHTICIRRQLPHSTIIPDVIYPEHSLPLLRRGWAFQERLMATRTVHFLRTEMIWECRSKYDCECGSCSNHVATNARYPQSSFYSRSMQAPSKANLTFLWQSLISSYSYRQFTKYRDRHFALQGIVSKFREAGLGEYHTGLWRKDIILHLLWSSTGGVSDVLVVDDVVFSSEPSWSWSSIPYPVEWINLDVSYGRPECEFIEITAENSIILEGAFTEATADLNSNKLWKIGVDLGFIGETWIADPSFGTGRRECDFISDVGRSQQFRRRQVVHGQNLTLVLIFISEKRVEGEIRDRAGERAANQPVITWTALALIESTKQQGAFERVGLARGKYISFGEDKMNWFRKTSRQNFIIL